MKLKQFFLLFGLLAFFNTAFTQTDSVKTSLTDLKVGIAGSEPFVFLESQTGISIDTWEEIAKKNNWKYNYTRYNSIENALNALKKREVDVLVGPFSITANRLKSMQFSQPFYNSSISIISRTDELSVWQKIKPLFSLKLLMAIGIFLIILAGVGTLLWLAERKKSPEQFPHDPLRGIGTGMWLAIVTMSTTGYGDKAPITLMGRIIAGAWMVISIISATTMVAGIASTLSISSNETSIISNIEQLSGRKTATISGSSSEDLLRRTNAKIVLVSKLDKALDKLENKEVDALVFDRPQLLYILKNMKRTHSTLVKLNILNKDMVLLFRSLHH